MSCLYCLPPSSKRAHFPYQNCLACFFMFVFLLIGGAQAATDDVTNNSDSGSGSLRDTIGTAAVGDTVSIDSSTVTSITLATPISINSNNLNVMSTGLTTLNGNGQQIFTWSDTGNGVNLSNLLLTGGSSSGAGASGGAFSSSGEGSSSIGTINGSTWQNNQAIANDAFDASASGGALCSQGTTSTIGDIMNSIWINNSATATATDNNSYANAYGGAISSQVILSSSNGAISGSTWQNNQAIASATYSAAYGGALSFQGSTPTVGNIIDSNWTNNLAMATSTGGSFENPGTAYAYGGAISSYVIEAGVSSIGSISGSISQNNRAIANATFNASAYGGAISSKGSTSTVGDIINSFFTSNSVTATATGLNSLASASGGAVYSFGYGSSSIGAINGSTWQNNQAIANATEIASAYGGALSSQNGASTIDDITNSTWISNSAMATVTDSYSQASAFGGAIYASANSGTSSIGDITNSTWSGNLTNATANGTDSSAEADGGAIYANASGGTSSIGDITNSQWTNNSATATGGSATATGGAIALSSDGDSTISSISGSTWSGNSVQATANDSGFNIYAKAVGGAISLYSYYGVSSIVGPIDSSTFSGNAVSAKAIGPDSSAWAYGGAIYTTALGTPLTITDSTFKNNTVSASGTPGQTYAGGGAIFIDTSQGSPTTDSIITLLATNGNTTLFQGNTVSVNDAVAVNSLAFSRSYNVNTGTIQDSMTGAILNIIPDIGGTVALNDPISVDINYGYSFAMNINGSGTFIWGGVNQIDVENTGSATNVVNFNAGRIILQPDFTLTSSTGNLAVNLTGGANGITLAPILTGRSQILPIFDSPASFTVTGGKVLVDPSFTGPNFTGSQSWLLTNSSGSVTSTDFTTASNASFITSISQTGSDIFIVLTEEDLPSYVVSSSLGQSPDPNIRNAYNSGALTAAWTQQQALLSSTQSATAINQINSEPQLLTGEAYANQNFAALNMIGDLSDRAWKLSHQSNYPYGERIDPTNTFSVRTWAGYTRNTFNMSGSDGYYGLKSSMNGGMGGFSMDIGSKTTVSMYIAGASQQTDADALLTGIATNATQSGLLASYAILPQLAFGLESGYAWLSNSGSRSTPFGNYTSSYGQKVSIFGSSLEFDAPFGINYQLSITPRIRHLRLDQDAINESGSNSFWAVNTGSPSIEATISTVNTSVSHDFIFGNGRSVTTTVEAEWRHLSGNARLATVASLGNSSSNYTLTSLSQDRDAAKIGGSISSVVYSFYGGINIFSELDYYTTRSNNATDNVCLAQMTLEF